MPDRPVTTDTAERRDRHAEFASHIERIDKMLEESDSASAVAALLRERRMTLNAMEGLTIADGPGADVDDIKRKREERRRRAAAG